MDFADTCAGLPLLLAACRRLSARLDPVRPDPDAHGRPRRRAQRSAPAISARPMCCAPATRSSPRLTLLLDALKGTVAGADRRPFLGTDAAIVGGLRRLSRPSLPGLARLQGRQGCCHLSSAAARPCAGMVLVFAVVWIAVAFISRYSSLAALVATVVTTGCTVLHRRKRRRPALVVLMTLISFWKHRPEYRAAARRHGEQDRGEGLRRWRRRTERRASRSVRAHRQAAACLAPADPHDNVGPVTFRDLINHFGSAETALEMLPDLSARGGAPRRSPRCASAADAERELESPARHRRALRRHRRAGLSAAALREIDGAPPLIAVKGNRGRLPASRRRHRRRAQRLDRRHASSPQMLARDLGAAGYAIVSGLARGIDTAAHRGEPRHRHGRRAGRRSRPALPAGKRRAAATQISDGDGARRSAKCRSAGKPRARDFPRRNRLIAGVCRSASSSSRRRRAPAR